MEREETEEIQVATLFATELMTSLQRYTPPRAKFSLLLMTLIIANPVMIQNE
jgi:hypothetical protein